MSPESRLTPGDLSSVLAARRILPALAGAVEKPDDFAKQNGHHPPDPAEQGATDTPPSGGEMLPEISETSPEDQPPAAA